MTQAGSGSEQRWPQWSADGARILFQTGRPGVATAVAGGERRPVPYPGLSAGVAPRRITGALPRRRPRSRQPGPTTIGRLLSVAPTDCISHRFQRTPDRLRWSSRGSGSSIRLHGRRTAAISRSSAGASTSRSEKTALAMCPPAPFSCVNLESAEKHTRLTSGDWLDANPVWMPDGPSVAVHFEPRWRP